MTAIYILLVLAIIARLGDAPAAAQSLPVKAAAEARFAMQNCLDNHLTPYKIFAGFTLHGFYYSKEDLGGGPQAPVQVFQ